MAGTPAELKAINLKRVAKPAGVVLLALPTLLVVALLELLVRTYTDRPDPARQMFTQLKMCEPHPTRLWQYKPFHGQTYRTSEFEMRINTNSWRLRDEEVSSGFSDGGVRILAIGDSFTFGWGVQAPERFTEQLSKATACPEASKLIVLNAGHWNYTFDQQLLLLEELLPRFRPDLVLQGVYPPHLITIGEHAWERDSKGRLLSIRFASSDNLIRVNPDGSLRRTNRLIEDPPLHSQLIAKLLQRYYRARQINREAVSPVWLYDPRERRTEGWWRLAREAISEAARHSTDAGALHVIFSVPDNAQVDPSKRGPQFIEAAGSGKVLDFDLPQPKFEDAARDSGAIWVDLVPVFRSEFRKTLYFDRDPHWTAEGHRLAALALAPTVCRALSERLARKTSGAPPRSTPTAASR